MSLILSKDNCFDDKTILIDKFQTQIDTSLIKQLLPEQQSVYIYWLAQVVQLQHNFDMHSKQLIKLMYIHQSTLKLLQNYKTQILFYVQYIELYVNIVTNEILHESIEQIKKLLKKVYILYIASLVSENNILLIQNEYNKIIQHQSHIANKLLEAKQIVYNYTKSVMSI